jgi:hypothetical protein
VQFDGSSVPEQHTPSWQVANSLPPQLPSLAQLMAPAVPKHFPRG